MGGVYQLAFPIPNGSTPSLTVLRMPLLKELSGSPLPTPTLEATTLDRISPVTVLPPSMLT